jgi:cell volume regulation protein A
MRTSLQPLIDRFFDPGPEPPSLPAHGRLTFNAVATLEQLHRFYCLPLPEEISARTAAGSLGALPSWGAQAEWLVSGSALHGSTEKKQKC